MTDLDLLIFGCAVSFVALGGVFIYLGECFARGRKTRQCESREANEVEGARFPVTAANGGGSAAAAGDRAPSTAILSTASQLEHR